MTSPTTLRDQGIALAENAADPRLILAIDAVIERHIASGQAFSANDIRDEMPTVTSKGLVGGRMLSYAARRNPRVLTCVGTEPSNLPSTHNHDIKRWVGAEHVRGVAS